MNEKFFVNLFDCENCGTTKIYAFLHSCPGCGTPNPGQGHWYKGPQVTDLEMLRRAARKPFWKCSNCTGSNYGEDNNCEHCGNPYDPSDISAKVIRQGESQTERPSASKSRSRSQLGYTVEAQPPRSSSEPAYSMGKTRTESYTNPTGLVLDKQTVGIAAVVLLAIALLGWFLFAKFHTESQNVRVAGFSWVRSVEIERFESVHHSDSTWNPPASAYNIDSWVTSEQKEVTRTEYFKVEKMCHRSEDLGNGFTREWDEDCSYQDSKQVFDHYDTIYTTHYSYDNDEWIYNRPAVASANDREAFWPQYTLNLEGQTVLGAERAVNAKENYTVHFEWFNKKEEKFTDTLDVREAEWLQYDLDEYYPARINMMHEIMNNPLLDKLNIQVTPEVPKY